MATDPIAAARALLPWWIPWGNLFVAIGAATLIAGLATWLTAAIATRPLRKAVKAGALAPDDHARLLYPFTRSVGRNRIAMAIMIPAAAAFLGDDLAYVPRVGVVVVAAVVTIFVSGRIARRFRPDAPMAKATRAQRWKALGFVAIWLCRLPLVLAMLYLIDAEPDVKTWLALLLGGAAFVSLWFGSITWLMRVLRIARPGSERLLAAVRIAAERCGTRVPAVFEIDLPITNAFAFPTSHGIVAMRGLLDHLDDAELASICTHEAAHLTEGPWMVVGRHLGDIALLILGASRLLFARLDFVAMVTIDLAVAVAAVVVVKLVASHGERRADAIAHRAEPSPDVYLRALEKIHRLNGIPLALSKRSGMPRGFLRRLFGSGGTHGSFADRAASLGAAAPAVATPPSRARTFAARLAGAAVIVAGVTAMAATSMVTWVWTAEGAPRSSMVQLAICGDAANEFALLASEWKRAGRVDDAVTLLTARVELAPESLDAPFDLASALADAGRIAQARAALARANSYLHDPEPHVHHGLVDYFMYESDEDRKRLEQRSRELAQRLGGDGR